MKVSYTGIHKDLPAKLQEKLDTRFAKLGRLADGRGEKYAHVVVSAERYLHKAEITVRVHEHQMVGVGTDADLFTALGAALDKIEKQVVNEGQKWRATTRRSHPLKSAAVSATLAAVPGKKASNKTLARKPAMAVPRVFHSNSHERRKPITLEEALLQMEDGRDYLVYRDTVKQSVFILVRRRDGNFDLIES